MAEPGLRKEFRWTLIAFVFAGLLVSGLVVWQLAETNPVRWCVVATTVSPEQFSSCASLLLKLLEIKDHVLIGLLIILGITVISLTAVALGVKINADGPGGLSVDIGTDQTTTITTTPAPPSEERQ